MQTRYWYVYQRWGRGPTHRHFSYDGAAREAQRLIETIGGEYEILEAVAVVKAAPKYIVEPLYNSETISAEQNPDDGIPF